MRKYCLIIMLAVCVSSLAQSIQSPKVFKCEAFLPEILAKKVILEQDIKLFDRKNFKYGQKGKSTKSFWVVYSDRSDNETYDSPNLDANKVTTLEFNEEVRIAKIEGDFALVYKEPKNNSAYPNISELAEFKGWVPLGKLLLWQSCPANEHGIYHKALIAANIDKRSNTYTGALFYNPEKKAIGKVRSSMDFYFVMKHDPEHHLVLLSRLYTLGGTNSQQLYGWVHENSYVPWNQRSCLEPNWNRDDVDYFKKYGQRAIVYTRPQLDTITSQFEYGVENSHDKNMMTKFRLHKEALRFPILDNDDDDEDKELYKCTTFGDPSGNVTSGIADFTKKEEMKKACLNKLENMNLIVVIDGTRSMDKYFPVMRDAIKDAFDYINQDYKVKVGVVIYRDYADGNHCVEYLPLQRKEDYARVVKFLDRAGDGSYGVKSAANDYTHTEALYKGLEVALDAQKMGYAREHGNLIMVVGDCGNDEADKKCISEDAIIEKLVDYNIQLMAFQVRRNNQKPWLLFTHQMNRLMMGSMSKQYGNLDAKVRFKEMADGYDLVTNAEHKLFVAANRFSALNTDMPESELSKQIKSNVSRFNEAIQEQIEIIDKSSEFDVSESKHSESANISSEFLKHRVGEEFYNMVVRTRTIVAFTGYTTKIHQSGRELWKPVIYISDDELTELIKSLRPLYDAAQKQSNDRQPYVQAIKALIRSMVPEITEDEMNEKGVGEVTRIMSGLNEHSVSMDEYTLLEVQEKISHAEYLDLCARFAKKFEKLERVKNGYEYSIRTNNKVYYWIPVEDLP